MNTPKEDLFDGIQIMSPSELESSIEEETTDETTEESKETSEKSTELSIDPVVTEAGDKGDDPSEEKELTPKIVAKDEATEETTKEEESLEISEEKKEAFYTAMLKEMIDEGVIVAPESEEELKGSLDKLKELMSGTLEKAFTGKISEWKSSFSGAKKRFLEIEDAFSGADQAIQAAQDLEFFENVTDESIKEDTNLQKQIYHRYLQSKNFSEEDIKEAIEDADAIGKLEDKAKKAVPQLKKQATTFIEESRKVKVAEEAKWEKQREDSYNNLMSSIDKKEEFIDGLKLNKVTKEKLKSNITKPVYTDDKGKGYTSLMYKQMKNPAEFEMLINYYDSLGMFDIDKSGNFKPNITKIKNVAKTQAVSEIDKVIASTNERGVGRQTSNDPSKKTQSTLDFFERAFGDKTKKRKT